MTIYDKIAKQQQWLRENPNEPCTSGELADALDIVAELAAVRPDAVVEGDDSLERLADETADKIDRDIIDANAMGYILAALRQARAAAFNEAAELMEAEAKKWDVSEGENVETWKFHAYRDAARHWGKELRQLAAREEAR